MKYIIILILIYIIPYIYTYEPFNPKDIQQPLDYTDAAGFTPSYRKANTNLVRKNYENQVRLARDYSKNHPHPQSAGHIVKQGEKLDVLGKDPLDIDFSAFRPGMYRDQHGNKGSQLLNNGKKDNKKVYNDPTGLDKRMSGRNFGNNFNVLRINRGGGNELNVANGKDVSNAYSRFAEQAVNTFSSKNDGNLARDGKNQYTQYNQPRQRFNVHANAVEKSRRETFARVAKEYHHDAKNKKEMLKDLNDVRRQTWKLAQAKLKKDKYMSPIGTSNALMSRGEVVAEAFKGKEEEPFVNRWKGDKSKNFDPYKLYIEARQKLSREGYDDSIELRGIVRN